MADKHLRPFLTFTTPSPSQPLSAALTRLESPEVTSPWTPKPAIELAPLPPASVGPTVDEISQLIDEAKAQGLAEGLAETAALRAQLAKLVSELGAARNAIVEPTAETIADAACCVVEAWLGHADRSAVFLPVIRAWLQQAGTPPTSPGSAPPPTAIARVHPDDVAALTQAITDASGGAPLAIVADSTLAPGAVELKSLVLELSHSWHARLPELRTQILTALTGIDDEDDGDGAETTDRDGGGA